MAIMQVSRKVDYALRAVIHLADAEAAERICSVGEISSKERIPRQFLEKIVQELIHKGLVRSRRGPHGGCVLARPADQVTFKDVIEATFRGQLFTAIAQGLVTGIGLAITGVPGAGFWGAVAALLSLIPMVGAAAVWVPAAIYLVISASMGARPWWQAIFLIVWGLLPVSLIDNIVRPWAMKGKAQLPAIPLLFAVLGGLQAFGFVGLVIGPLVFSLLMSIIDIYKKSFSMIETSVVVESGVAADL